MRQRAPSCVPCRVTGARIPRDANLSPKVGRFLRRRLHRDVVSLQGQGRGQLPDQEAIRMARSAGRGVITLNPDVAADVHRAQRPDIGIVSLDLPNLLRTIPQTNRLLAAFFRQSAHGADLEHALVVITEHEARIVQG
ncbi:MAG: DUF5615 family PIN-like protein [Chloroflexota bacterium]|nr:DUF5615 family PIN-like protein [Chloroflexota bacterium]